MSVRPVAPQVRVHLVDVCRPPVICRDWLREFVVGVSHISPNKLSTSFRPPSTRGRTIPEPRGPWVYPLSELGVDVIPTGTGSLRPALLA
jgi:hypothetical protein